MSGQHKQPTKKSKLVNVHDDLWTLTLSESVLSKVGITSDFKMNGVKLLFGIDISKSMKVSKTYTNVCYLQRHRFIEIYNRRRME